ncbi:TonB-dependent siderophore receptor [Microcoleus sp. herbarium19]|uniref:TonB-dependent siderophore receptor n=1 Tax=unclassified Microcoleus TaxID=2642155 RepID=UPI002FD568A7
MLQRRKAIARSIAAASPPDFLTPTLQETPKQAALLSELDRPATTVGEWISQIEATAVQITGVRVEETEKGLQVVLETESGELPVPTTRTIDKTLIAEIPNARIVENFVQVQPIAGIARVEVTGLEGDRVRVAITGTDAAPVGEVTSEAQGLAFAIGLGTAAAEDKDEIELVVTGRRAEGYNPSRASTATRTDTPLRDIPASIQAVPQEVLRDRNIRSLTEAVETVSGVIDNGDLYGSSASSRTIRGFQQSGNFRNGYRDAPNTYILSSPIGVVEQVEVLKGPASVLFGNIEPGGIVNVTTKQPLREPAYTFAFEAGNRNFYQPSIDFTGPLTTDKSLLYRFIANYQTAGGFQDFVNTNQITIAPSIAWRIGDNTELNLYYEYAKFTADPPVSFSFLRSDGRLSPRNLFTNYPNFFDTDQSVQRFGYTFTHQFSDSWQIRNNFGGLLSKVDETPPGIVGVENDRFLRLDSYDLDYGYDNYFGQIDLLGKFNTGSISHQLLIGFDVNDYTDSYQGRFNTNLPLLDIQNPNYDVPEPIYEPFFEFENRVQSYGLYLQDQIAFGNFKLLIGGRYDWVSSTLETANFSVSGNPTTDESAYDTAFSPRIGLVYQPSDTISLYTSYSRSFRAQTGSAASALGFNPTEGTQYEVGIKADWLDGRLSTTLAAYNLTKTNVLTTDPNNPQFSIQTGEQRSQGIELDIAGEILPGWRVIASYAYTDAEVTADKTIPVGNRLQNVPENQASLWTTYEIQTGSLRGLGFGLGLFYLGERQGDLANSFQLKDYLRTDASLFYQRDRFRAALNVRNLLDIDYVTSAFGQNFIQRGAPFTITGSVSWEF